MWTSKDSLPPISVNKSICHYCDRAFCNELSFQQHFKNSSAHEWCDRCQQAFNSVTAKQQHLSNSTNEHRCTLCSSSSSSAPAASKVPPDFFSYRDLKDHLENFHHYCTACNQHHVSAGGLRSHDLTVHNMCSVCDSLFQTPDNLRAVCFFFFFLHYIDTILCTCLQKINKITFVNW